MADDAMIPIEFGVPDVAAFHNHLNDAVRILDAVAESAQEQEDAALVARCDAIIEQLEYALASMKGKASASTRRAMVGGAFLR